MKAVTWIVVGALVGALGCGGDEESADNADANGTTNADSNNTPANNTPANNTPQYAARWNATLTMDNGDTSDFDGATTSGVAGQLIGFDPNPDHDPGGQFTLSHDIDDGLGTFEQVHGALTIGLDDAAVVCNSALIIPDEGEPYGEWTVVVTDEGDELEVAFSGPVSCLTNDDTGTVEGSARVRKPSDFMP